MEANVTGETLTSLAVLKASIDEGRDYLDYLRPFVTDYLAAERPDRVTDSSVAVAVRSRYGLVVPTAVVHVVLKRLAKEKLIVRRDGIYVLGHIPESSVLRTRREASREQVERVATRVVDYAFTTHTLILTTSEACDAIVDFLSLMSISGHREFLVGTLLPTSENLPLASARLVAVFLNDVVRNEPTLLADFADLACGNMLANALISADLNDAPKTFRGTTLFLDTPIVLRALGLEGQDRRFATHETLKLARSLAAEIRIFSHTREEVARVIRGAASWLDHPEGRGGVVEEARRLDMTKSDLLLLEAKLDSLLEDEGLEVEPALPFVPAFQIDEEAFQDALDGDDVSYMNPRALADDVQSVRSVYALRRRAKPTRLEDSVAVVVTSNTGLARVAQRFGKEHEPGTFSPVVTEFSIANTAWLKAPMDDPELPRLELLAWAYAAFNPTKKFREGVSRELAKLEKAGNISASDHQFLRSSVRGQDELIRATLGEESALTGETVAEVLRRVKSELIEEERGVTAAAQAQARAEAARAAKLAAELEQAQAENRNRDRVTRNRADRWAKWIAIAVTGLALVGCGVGIVAGLATSQTSGLQSVVLWAAVALTALATLTSFAQMLIGWPKRTLHKWVYDTVFERVHGVLRGEGNRSY